MKRAVAAALLAGSFAFTACGSDDSGDSSAPTSSSAGGSSTTAGGSSTTADEKTATARASSFGNGGIAALPLSADAHDRLMAVTIAPDGKVYAAGFVNQGGDQAFALTRIDPETAKLDTSFGNSGVATVNVAVGGKTAELARAVRVQADGKIVIAGPFEADPAGAGDAAKDTNVALARFDATGKIDASFGQGGVAKLDFGTGKATSATAFVGDTSWGIAGGPGERTYVFGSRLADGADRVDADYVVAAVTSAGVLDSSFGTGGTVTVDPKTSGVDSPRGIIVQDDGKIVTAVYTRDGDGIVSPVVLRLTPTGDLDTTFGTGGFASAAVLAGVAEAYNIARHDDGYVLAGYGRGADANEKVDHIVYRFTDTGAWDQSFGDNGVVRLDLAKEDDRARNVTALEDGRILTAGSGKKTAADIDGMAVLLDASGKPVADFGTSGYDLMDLGGPADSLYGLAVSPDGDYAVIVGYKGVEANGGGNDDAVAVRIDL